MALYHPGGRDGKVERSELGRCDCRDKVIEGRNHRSRKPFGKDKVADFS